MAYTKQGSADILEADDKMISALFISLIFIAATAAALAFIGNNTTIFSGIGSFVMQVMLLFGFLFILAIAANYKALDLIQDHAYTIIKWCYILGMAFTIGMLLVFGLLLSVETPFGFVLVGLGILFAFIYYRIWPWLHERIKRAAEWLKIAATIVLNEPGMIVLSFIQSIIVGVTTIVEGLSIFAWTRYAEAQSIGQETSDYIGYLIMFFYLWLALFVIYYFDGANTFMAYARIHGRDPTMGQGLNVAGKRALSILGYALITSIVTVIVRLLFFASRNTARESRGDIRKVILSIALSILGSIVSFLYYLVSFFTLPAIIIRQKNTREAMKESYNLFKQTLWDIIISDTGYNYGSMIMYLFTGLILAVFGFGYGYFVGAALIGSGSQVFVGIIIAIIALVFGLFTSRFFLKPLYTSLVTTMYTYATEGESALQIVPSKLKNYLHDKSRSPEATPTK